MTEMEEPWWYPMARTGLEDGWDIDTLLKFKFPREVNLRVAVAEYQPFIQTRRDPISGGLLVTGPSYNLLNALATSLNFTYTFVEGDGLFGAPLPNGSWDGVIGLTMRGEADLLLGPLLMTYSRMKAITFTHPLLLESFRILQARPSSLPQPLGLLAPFSMDVWMWFLASCVLVTLTSLVLGVSLGSRGRPFLVDHVLSSVAIVTGKALPWEPRPLPLRVLFGMWMLAAIIITQSYGGSLTSLLAVQKVPAKYDSLRQVVDDPNATIILEASTAFTAFFTLAKEGIYKELSDALRSRGRFVTSRQLVESVPLLRDGQHVIILEERTGLKFMSDDVSQVGTCELYMSSEYFFPSVVSMAGPKDSPLVPFVNARILMLREYGLYDAWITSELNNISQCTRPLGAILRPYSVENLMSTFVILAVGLGVATVLLLLEVLRPLTRTESRVKIRECGKKDRESWRKKGFAYLS